MPGEAHDPELLPPTSRIRSRFAELPRELGKRLALRQAGQAGQLPFFTREATSSYPVATPRWPHGGRERR